MPPTDMVHTNKVIDTLAGNELTPRRSYPINLITVVPFILMLYDYAITLDKEVEYIWKRCISVVNLIYFALRYVGTIFALFYTGALLWGWNFSNKGQVNNYTLRLLQIWPLLVEIWLVQIILQMRLYVLYHRSKRVLFIVILGFIIEVTVSLVTMIRLSIFQANNTVNQAVEIVTAFPASETIGIYVNYMALLLYEFLLFSLALVAAIQCSKHSSATNQVGTRDLRVILIEGNVMYFLGTLLHMVSYLIVSLTFPEEYLYVTTNVACAVFTILGCQIILHIRSADSQLLTNGTNASHSIGQNYSLEIFRYPTHSSIPDGTAYE
ncbi:hypothetical protein J3A83DRAFT_2949140 [Scleroderma citrinum]